MRKCFSVVAVILLLLVTHQVVQAGTFYQHEHASYWWFVVDKPAFSAVVPSKGQYYMQRSVFGMDILEISFANGTITMEVISQPGTSIESVRNSLDVRYKPLVKNITILNNGEITTSNNLKAHFYAYEATGANGKKVMFRSVFFQKGNHVVYLTLLLDADKYQGDMREYWLRAVNEFEWN